MGRKLPRTNAETVVLQGKVWNHLCDEVERQGKLSVTAPLTMYDGPGGPQIALLSTKAGTGRVALVQDQAGRGFYNGSLVHIDVSGDINPDGDIDSELSFASDDAPDIVICNLMEMDGGPLKLKLPGYYPVVYQHTNSDGTQYWATRGFKWTACAPPEAP